MAEEPPEKNFTAFVLITLFWISLLLAGEQAVTRLAHGSALSWLGIVSILVFSSFCFGISVKWEWIKSRISERRIAPGSPRSTKHVIEGSYAIESDAFPGCYLRMDGNGITEAKPEGAGVVNCQKGQGPWERFRVVPLENGLIAIESIEFRNRWLRMDGSQIPLTGKGIVNCQFGFPGAWEIFSIVSLPKGLIALRSAHFPDVFLGMDATGLTDRQTFGGGAVYCRRSYGPSEKFRLRPLPKE